jgi:hypothetical protein
VQEQDGRKTEETPGILKQNITVGTSAVFEIDHPRTIFSNTFLTWVLKTS